MKPDREYMDDLGGAYHFAPRDIYDYEPTTADRIVVGILRLLFWAFLIYFIIL